MRNEKENTNFQELAEQYEAINRMLENRLQEEIVKNKEKDLILIQQAKMAAMGEMIAGIGSQWRQPVNSLLMLIQDIRAALEYGEINGQYVDRFTRESVIQLENMSRTFSDFRKFYKPNLEKKLFSVSEAIEDALSIFSICLKNHGIQVDFMYRGQQMAYGYPNDFSQIVLSLLMNARDSFVEKDIKNRKIIIKICESDKYITAEFKDNAGGIEPFLLAKVFDPYFTSRRQGTGLGLYMSKTMLENMNGYISIENNGEGVSVSISVPKVTSAVRPELNPI
ncbi:MULTISPECIES: sensor histidine kinase [Neobacillus]|uniref:histidine kinase n=1 Tax=Neobacillus rhizophilus TaxID=2833579 RepID=A0A942TYI4_9BACI|nr:MULTISPECIES: HAMP domain-containing sensor histidine kinase [Neobacillus]MBS4211135.1 HAMP domain-containing histidine kinase [Neobacillus rhizophilus]MBU8917320.1 HAMP domain-containing histidine kinase [Bacillus sp. FJAT-29953]